MPTSKSKRYHRKPSRLPQVLIVTGIILLVFMILILKPDKTPEISSSTSSADAPAAQLDRALQAGQPTLAFFHSNNCKQCIVMMETVSQVYPEFSTLVTLVDVNVYDEKNAELLKSVGLQYIPTLIFYDHAGNAQVSVGVMEAEQLRQTLANLAGGE